MLARSEVKNAQTNADEVEGTITGLNPAIAQQGKPAQPAQAVTHMAVSAESSTSKPEASPETPKVGRNEPCPCGSGKKYKKCCG